MKEATTLFSKQVERKKMDVAKMGQSLGMITPTLSYGDFGSVDFVVEAVVENEAVKKKVFQEIESQLPPNAVLASNTSTISIGKLAQGLKRPEKFCGLHFFNPVHKMPLVEVIRGPKTSDETIAQSVAFALGLGKVPVVVNDCPGFLVNRVLFPYLLGFTTLLDENVGFEQVDKVMEKFGWPMGPAYLIDVVGLDTTVHAAQVMKEGFPDRMKFQEDSKIHKLLKALRLGQKNALGFYKYERDKKGGWKKSKDPQVYEILQITNPQELKPEVIIERIMIPMMTESIRCLEEKIVAGPVEVDMGVSLPSAEVFSV
jgi:3-hydroxyacyl-CoA dehydrogenase/enoyl-CoA hydratase/3-hydroxybutyryl-CoA epimerase/enoyl-CoA isomerase